jgi:type VI secretion system protein ImpJ
MTDTLNVPPKPRSERRKPRLATPAGDVPHAIQWHEGMLLAPQHFQWLSTRADTLVHYHTSSISPFYWGVKHLQLDTNALADGVVRVVDLEAVMPDGLIVSHSAASGTELKLDLKPHLESIRRQRMKIHLAVAVRGHDIPIQERYDSLESDPVADENTREGEVPVPVLAPRLQLIAGDPANRYVAFPLVEVAFRNEVISRTEFEPPWLRISPGNGIYQMCVALATRLREKATFLADHVRAPSGSVGTGQILDTKFMTHALVAGLPAFEALLRSGASHPFPLYVALCGIVGNVASVGLSLVPPLLDPYDHDDLYSTFAQAEAFVQQSVSEGVHERYMNYEFIEETDEFHLRIDPEWLRRPMILGVHTSGDSTDADTAAWVTGAVIASRSRVDSQRDRRMLGVTRVRSGPETDLVPSRGTTLYALAVTPELVVGGEDLVITNAGADQRGRPDRIVLYVKNRSS